MKILYPLLATTCIIAGCVTSGQAVKEYNVLNVFLAQMPAAQSVSIISEMSKYCSRNLFEIESRNFPSIKKSTLDYKVKNGSSYFMRIEVDEINQTESKAFIYHYMNTDVTRNMATQVERWVTKGSKECVPGF